MPILHVRSIPEKTYRRVRKLAERDGVSLSAEVARLLDAGIELREDEGKVPRLLREIYRNRIVLPKGAPSSEELIREDRNR